MGFLGVEFDVMLAGGDLPVLIHDETFERTTSGKGSVPLLAYTDIERFDAGGWHSAAFKGERVPTFEMAAKLCRDLGLWANVEIKPAKGCEAQTGRAVAQMTQDLWRGADLPPVLSSFSMDALAAAKEVAPSLPSGLLVGFRLGEGAKLERRERQQLPNIVVEVLGQAAALALLSQ